MSELKYYIVEKNCGKTLTVVQLTEDQADAVREVFSQMNTGGEYEEGDYTSLNSMVYLSDEGFDELDDAIIECHQLKKKHPRE